VHFASPIRQESPKLKARPLLEQPSLKFGDFNYSVLESLPAKSYLRQDYSTVLASRVFGSIKNHLKGKNPVDFCLQLQLFIVRNSNGCRPFRLSEGCKEATSHRQYA
jgi:hypothetical protein